MLSLMIIVVGRTFKLLYLPSGQNSAEVMVDTASGGHDIHMNAASIYISMPQSTTIYKLMAPLFTYQCRLFTCKHRVCRWGHLYMAIGQRTFHWDIGT